MTAGPDVIIGDGSLFSVKKQWLPHSVNWVSGVA